MNEDRRLSRSGSPPGETESALSAGVRDRLVALIRPQHQDLDGLSHFEEVERTARLARQLYRKSGPAADRHFELMLLFQRLGPWLRKVGNLSRTLLVSRPEVEELDLRRVAQSLGRLETPESESEIALAAAQLIESCGLRALVERFNRARREGLTVRLVADEVIGAAIPDRPWLTDEARALVRQRFAKQQAVCRDLIEEM